MSAEAPDQEITFNPQKWPDGPPPPDAIFLGAGQLALKGILAMQKAGIVVGAVGRSDKEPAGRVADIFYTGDINDGRYFADPARTGAKFLLDTEHVDQPWLLENVPAEQMLFPVEGLAYTQDKLIMHQKMKEWGIPIPDFVDGINSLDDLIRLAAKYGFRGMLQRRRGAYDGRGNALIDGVDSLEPAWKKIGQDGGNLFLEQFVDFESELAIQIIRGHGKDAFSIVESRHRDGQLYIASATARFLDARTYLDCMDIAQNISSRIPGLGPITIELFKLKDADVKPGQSSVKVNEFCLGRYHNSQHLTEGPMETSQFDQSTRLVLGQPIGSVAFVRGITEARMVNLLGTRNSDSVEIKGVREVGAEFGARIQPYYKTHGVGRKLGDMGVWGNDEYEVDARSQAGFVRLNELNDGLFQYHPHLFNANR